MHPSPHQSTALAVAQSQVPSPTLTPLLLGLGSAKDRNRASRRDSWRVVKLRLRPSTNRRSKDSKQHWYFAVFCVRMVSCCKGVIYLHCLQNVKERNSETVSSSGKRKSIKASDFAATHAELLKPIYKYYQAMQFASYGHRFKRDALNRKVCVQMLLDAAKECHSREIYTRFKKAVEAELIGSDGSLRY